MVRHFPPCSAGNRGERESGSPRLVIRLPVSDRRLHVECPRRGSAWTRLLTCSCSSPACCYWGALGEIIFTRTRVPDVVWLVGAGIVAGPLLGIISPELLQPGIPFFGAIALTVILSGGAFRLQLSEVAAAAPRGVALGIAGYLASIAGVFGFLWLAAALGYVPSRSPLIWLTIGAIVGGTSSIIIAPTMALGRAPARIACILEVESAGSSPPVAGNSRAGCRVDRLSSGRVARAELLVQFVA